VVLLNWINEITNNYYFPSVAEMMVRHTKAASKENGVQKENYFKLKIESKRKRN